MLGCLTWDGLDRYPDETRQRAEFGMALLSLGAAVENLMVAAADAGYASCWVAAPIFCPEAARDALALDPSGCRTRWSWSADPIPTYVGRPDRRSPSTSSAPSAESERRQRAGRGLGTSRR